MAITASTTSSDQEKFLAAKLISRLRLRLVASSLCTKISQPKGSGSTAYFVRYNRMNVPLATLTEGSDPSASSFTLTQFTVTLDQWGDIIEITDVAELTTKHPLMKQAMELLAENAQRVIDREVQIVWLANTNVQYGDGSVSSRRTVTAAMKANDASLHKAVVTLKDAGVSPRGGPEGGMAVDVESAKGSINGSMAYVAVCGPQVIHDILSNSSGNSFLTVAQYSNAKALYVCEVGSWLGIRFVETNFIPKFSMLGNTTAAVASGASGGITGLVVTAVDGGGSLNSATTFFWKVTRKDKLRGFEEAISIAHSTASAAAGNNESFTFALPSTAGYVYNVYFDTVATGGTGTDATLMAVATNQEPSATVTVTAVPSSGANPPDNVNTTGTPVIHPVFIHGEASCLWVGLQNLEVKVTKPGSILGAVLELKRAVGFKFMGKSIVPDSNKLLRVELASAY